MFNGLDNDDIATEYKAAQEYKYETSCIYYDLPSIKNIISECQANNIPLILITNKEDRSGCGYCQHLGAMLDSDNFKNWVSSNTKYMIVFGELSRGDGKNNSDPKWWYVIDFGKANIPGFESDGGYLYAELLFYWKKEDGTVSSSFKRGTSINGTPDQIYQVFQDQINSTFAGYERNTEMSVIINPEITKFGSSLPEITIVSKTGTEFKCTNENEVVYVPKVMVDYATADDFRFGVWYYNAKQLKAYADKHNIPVFLEFSSATCEPCKDFRENTFNNKEFQNAVRQKKCLLCRVELEGNQSWSTPNTQPYFCVNSWGDPKISIPQTVYYWKKSDGTTVKKAYWYNYRTDPVNSTYQTILSRIDDLTATYVPDPDMELESPEITTVQDKKSFKYQNQSMDMTGRFFICDRKTRQQTISV